MSHPSLTAGLSSARCLWRQMPEPMSKEWNSVNHKSVPQYPITFKCCFWFSFTKKQPCLFCLSDYKRLSLVWWTKKQSSEKRVCARVCVGMKWLHTNSNALILKCERGDFAGGKFIISSIHASVNGVLILISKASIKLGLEVFHTNVK